MHSPITHHLGRDLWPEHDFHDRADRSLIAGAANSDRHAGGDGFVCRREENEARIIHEARWHEDHLSPYKPLMPPTPEGSTSYAATHPLAA